MVETTQETETTKLELSKTNPIKLQKNEIIKSPIVNGLPDEISDSPGCPAWNPDWNKINDLVPKIPLDPNKYLIPVLTYGPNNQLRGFRETIFLAIKLNRTIIPPPFYKHSRTDESKNDGDEGNLSD